MSESYMAELARVGGRTRRITSVEARIAELVKDGPLMTTAQRERILHILSDAHSRLEA